MLIRIFLALALATGARGTIPSSNVGKNDDATTSTNGARKLSECKPIGPNHPAVLFDDRVTQQDFGKGGRNCSYFAIAPIEVAQQRLIDCVDELQREFATEAEKAEAANGTESKPKPWAAAAR